MARLLFGLIVILVFTGCGGRSPDVVEPTLEATPWLFPGPNIEELTAKDFRARAVAARSLGRMGAEAKAAIPELEKLVAEDKHPKVREMAAEALEKIRAEVDE